ncbi:N-formylglutamate amidohydrolase [Thalassobius vesicularis]|uniref:N-formylglutamate amidohydrolase n=1 Tax=Thalassobius vesicularis TaxID=1294297 RepID=A0A4S3MC44_9RHOB|nr:N-formylglutamate amidohydrolase [Thalassobius vesicularis]THD74116.1 N-formylglutamate amidohydrolase [Thalassobius vesicularis]
MPKAAYRLLMPQTRSTSVIFASPHSSRDYPKAFLQQSVLDDHSIRSSEDAFVDQLFNVAPHHGAPFLEAGAPRAYVDMNRSPDELDPALIQGMRNTTYNPRIVSGLGVVPRVVANSRCIYRGKLPLEEVRGRLDRYWHPYHARLQALLSESHALFGEAILIDCHSMPHEALDSIARSGSRRPEVVLGDRFGAASAPEVMEVLEDAFAQEGLVVARNVPFAGAYTTQHYGRPSRRQHVIQVEIDRALYMNEQMIRPNGNFAAMQAIVGRVIARITAYGEAQQRLAAE